MAAPVRTFPPIPYGMADFRAHAPRRQGANLGWGRLWYCTVASATLWATGGYSAVTLAESRAAALDLREQVVWWLRCDGWAAAVTHSRGAR